MKGWFLQAIAAKMKGLLKLVKPYDGSGDISKWLDKLKMLIKLQGLDLNTSEVIPYFLEGNAYELFSQLDKNVATDSALLEKSLQDAFGLDSFEAFEILRCKRWDGTETVDVYMAEIKRLASICNLKNDDFVKHSFITGLPKETAHQLRIQLKFADVTLSELVEKTRVLLKHNKESCMAMQTDFRRLQVTKQTFYCNKCNKSGHTAKFCRSKEDYRRCFKCDKVGHVAKNCQSAENDNEELLAPVPPQRM